MSAFEAVAFGIMLAASCALVIAFLQIFRWDGKRMPPAVLPVMATCGAWEVAVGLVLVAVESPATSVGPFAVGGAMLTFAVIARRVKGTWG